MINYQYLRSLAVKLLKHIKYRRTYSRFRDDTMISMETYCENLGLASRVAMLPGCVVECGVWRGGMSAGLVSVMGKNRQYLLFDSFEGLPPAQEIDGMAALNWQSDVKSPNFFSNCTAGEESARSAMVKSGATNFHLHKGWFNQTLTAFKPKEPIALLRLDADWYDSTTTCLESLFDHVVPGGIIILDDYFAWDGCSRALHDFLSKRSAVERIQCSGTVCFIVKQAKEEAIPKTPLNLNAN